MIPRRLFLSTLLFSSALVLRAADPHGDTILDPEQAGPDYAVQGEYIGEGCAAQVIALGDGKFHIAGWSKGFPAWWKTPRRSMKSMHSARGTK